MLVEEIRSKFVDARKNKDSIKKAIYESLVAKIILEEKSGKYSGALPDEAVQNVIQKEVKERLETQSFYKPEDEMFKTLSMQIKEIEQYLPKQMSEEEVVEIIKAVKESGETNRGKAIGAVVKQVGNQFDKSKIARLVAKYF